MIQQICICKSSGWIRIHTNGFYIVDLDYIENKEKSIATTITDENECLLSSRLTNQSVHNNKNSKKQNKI
jgi:hypothetical protein